jgi:O-antigen/teichoic acid export membrane protein
MLSYIALFLGTGVTLAYTPFMLRMLGQAQYGLFSLVNTTITYLTILDFGFGIAIVRYTAKYRAEKDKIKEETLHGMFLVLYIAIGILAFSLSLVLVFNIEWLFSGALTASELKTARILMWLAALNLAMSFPFSVYTSIITAHERFVYAKSIQLIRLVITPLLMVVVLTMGHKAVGMIVVTTGLSFIFNILNLLYCKRQLKIKMRFSGFDLPLLKEIGIYSFFIFLNMIVDRLYWSTGQFLLGIFVGTVAVAIYSIGVQFITMLYMPVSGATSGLFLPRLTQIIVKDSLDRDLSDMFIRVGRIQFIMLALVLSGFALYGKQFINLWAGPEYATSYIIAIVMMVPLTIPLIQNMGISILQAKNMHAFRSVIFLVIAVVNVAISIPLIKFWGPVGCAIGTSLSLIIGQIVIMNVYYRTRLKLEIGRFWFEISKIVPAVLVPGILSFLLLQLLPADHLSGFVVSVVLYTTLYCLSMYLFGMNLSEKHLILGPLKIFTRKFVTIR